MNSHDRPREGEVGPVPPRHPRTFQRADGWYFMTREGVNIGPFASQDLAEIGVQDYAGFSVDANLLGVEDDYDVEDSYVVPDESY